MNKTNPILLDIPDCFESERLLIRAPKPGDGAALNEAVVESIEQLRPWMPWAQEVPTPEDSETVIRRAHLSFIERSDLMLLLILKETGQPYRDPVRCTQHAKRECGKTSGLYPGRGAAE